MPQSRPHGKPRSVEAWVLAAALKAAPRLLRDFGADPAKVAQRAGLDLRTLGDPECRIPFSLGGRFLRECAAATCCPHFGLLVGTEEGLSALGVVGHLVQHSQDVNAALVNLGAYLHHQEIGASAFLSAENGLGVLTYAFHQQNLEGADQIVDGAMGIGMSIMRYLCGETWTPIEVQLVRAKPVDSAPYRRVFGSATRFGAERNAFLFHPKWLNQPLHAADPGLRKILEEKIAELEGQRSAEFPDEVRSVIRVLLLTGEASGDEAARRLSITRRTLLRRLSAFDATYEGLVNETRFDLARQLLRNSRASMTDIAVALNYANASAFTRAFRRWAGMTPRDWRRMPNHIGA